MNSCLECKHYKKDERIGIIVCEFGLHESYCEKDKEDFAIEELEKIKAEIDEKDEYMYDNDGFSVYAIRTDKVLDIIDKHIKENK